MENANAPKKDFGLETVLNRIKPGNYIPFNYELKETKLDFRTESELNPKFIAPILAQVPEYSTVSELKDACFILIEAVGASGKTELTKKMSHWLSCPVFDLGKTNVVAGNSLTGLLTKRMQRKDCYVYMDDISNGKSTIIIDALDEGYMKTNNQGYLDFLDDVLSLSPTKDCPIVMMGRYNAVELAAVFLLDKGVPFVTLQIEPFTINQARDFIDKASESVAKIKYQPIYKETRDYILQTIDGFFKDQASIKQHAAERFIGYAPVLMSIAKFFDDKTNYKTVLDEMKERNAQSVSLIVDIVERILKRDRDEKVRPQLLEILLTDRDESFRTKVIEQAYTYDEQCARVLYRVMNMPFPDIDIKDTSFLSAYNEHMKIWLEDHPFMGKHKIGNIVFESYILARLINNPKYKQAALSYMQKNGTSYMFAYIYYSMYGFKDMEGKILPYIYDSLRELNNKQNFYTLYLDYDPQSSDSTIAYCEFEFVGSNETMASYLGTVFYAADEHIDMGSHIEHVIVDTPLDFVLSKRNVEAVAPSYIKCNRLIVKSEEVTLYKKTDNASFMFECNKVLIEPGYDQFLQVVGPGKQMDILKVVCPEQPEYPMLEYWSSEDIKLKELTEDISTKYKKLRAIILEFRSHSKHDLAKHHERIDFVMGNNHVGKAVINALLTKKIMFQKGYLYKLDTEFMDRELGLSYDGIRNYEYSDEVIRFLRDIK